MKLAKLGLAIALLFVVLDAFFVTRNAVVTSAAFFLGLGSIFALMTDPATYR